MFKDLNKPEGLYGEHHDRITGANTRFVTKPYQELTQWENEAISLKVKIEARGEEYLLNELRGIYENN